MMILSVSSIKSSSEQIVSVRSNMMFLQPLSLSGSLDLNFAFHQSRASILTYPLFTVRPRKKNKQSLSRSKSSKSKPKKASSSQSSKQRAGPSNPADIDELVRGPLKKKTSTGKLGNNQKNVLMLILIFISGETEFPNRNKKAGVGAGEV